jgi:hypothetical protein
MLFYYFCLIENFNEKERKEWIDYINAWQDPKTGLFIGPELDKRDLKSNLHSFEHLAMHLTAHALPALRILRGKPKYDLTYAHRFLDVKYLDKWLSRRDWKQAWLEGNNLLFVGQFLIFLRDIESIQEAQTSINYYFDWLNKEQDPKTGLWGTNGHCPHDVALYGGYHQLLVYYYEKRPIRFRERLVDVALSLQHADGGFALFGGGGACEDVDAVDILVNMYKMNKYRRADIRCALRLALNHILNMQMDDGGFVYRINEPFIHMGINKTASNANQSNMFSTWFRIHTLCLISEILNNEKSLDYNWGFNDVCSMGWHEKWKKNRHKVTFSEKLLELPYLFKMKINRVKKYVLIFVPQRIKNWIKLFCNRF